MTIQFFGYPKCSTCNKAKKWLKDNEVEFEYNDIVENPLQRNSLTK